ncbi:MAG TPA: HAMP domain-containing sensor histidine kinase [Jatrophihabitantaceae bacterium]|nr:HAMP domain-containing sensor histidine kinase [Jatrophihabitantaceae bacterium]
MRRRVLLLVVGMTTLVVLAFAVPLGLVIRNVVYKDAVDALEEEANQIAAYLHSDFTAPSAAQISAYLASRSDDRDASVELADGTVVGKQPPDAADLPPLPQMGNGGPHDGDEFGGNPPSTSAVSFHGGKLSQFTVPGENRGEHFVVRVYASNARLHSGENGWWLLLGGSSLGLLLLGIVGAELLTRRIVRPLTRTAQTAHQLSGGDTAARAPVDGPREIAEVGVALNRLADRIDELIAEERETVADLSHRMRTPLTSLRLDAEALRDPGEAERVGAHVSALERTLTAVIHAARRPQREGRMPSSDATSVVAERVQFWSALADDQNRRTNIDLPDGPVLVRTSADDLAAAVDALLENVFAHTAEGVAFSVTLVPVDGGGARLDIADEGAGIPPDAVARGRSDRGSSGLGLSIARRSAEASGGSITVTSSTTGGALITLIFGAP